MRFRVPEIFLGCFLTIAVFAAGMLFKGNEQATPPAQSASQQATASEGQKAQNPDSNLTGSTWLTKDASSFFTSGLVVIGIFQVAMFFFQLRYMRQGMDDATMVAKAAVISAKAAKVSAEHIPNVERAYVFFAGVTCDGLKGLPRGTFLTVKYSYKNSGRTPAIMKRIQVGIEYRESVPSDADFTYGDGWLPTIHVVGGDKIGPENDVLLSITGADFEKARTEIGRIFFWSKLTYLDVFGASHETCICSEWHFGQRRFVISTDAKELNYHN
jgi:hypothetical protein